MYGESMNIVWDQNKAIVNFNRHGVSFESAVSALSDDLAITIEDTDHDEERFITIGMGTNFTLLVVVYCYPDEMTVRIISARKAEPHERKDYEQCP